MGRFFPPEYGEIEVTPFYSNNKIYCREVRFSIPEDQWFEFENSDAFRILSTWKRQLKIPHKTDRHHEVECEQENEELLPHSMYLGYPGSFLARVRKLFHRK